MFLAIYEDLEVFKGLDGFLKGLVISVIAMAIVFAILLIICLLVKVLKLIGNMAGKNKKEEKSEKFIPATNEKKAFSAEDIKDDDMMAAILVATIDYVSETKEDARVVSAKQIG